MSTPSQLIIFDNREQLFQSAAEALANELLEAVVAAGGCSFVLSGGSTPAGLYTHLAADARLDWKAIDIFWGDERYVPPVDPESNYRMVHETLLSKVSIPSAKVHRVLTEDPDPDDAARLYEQQIRAVLHLGSTDFPRFDVTLLGLGADAHTASLFPGSPLLHERRRLAASVRVEVLHSIRITLTPPALNHSSCIFFLVAGREKSAALQAVMRAPYDPDRWPGQIVRPAAGRLTFLVDRDAASLL